MNPEAMAGMIFTLIVIAMVLGFILLFPVTKRLGLLLEQKLAEKPARIQPDSSNEVMRTREQVQALESEVRMLAERQQFVEELVSQRETKALPADINEGN